MPWRTHDQLGCAVAVEVAGSERNAETATARGQAAGGRRPVLAAGFLQAIARAESTLTPPVAAAPPFPDGEPTARSA